MNNDLATIFGGAAFDPNSVEPAKDFDVIPPGKPLCLIEAAEVKQTKAGTGYGLQLGLLIVEEGPSKNRKLFPWINLQNPNVVCEEIGRREFAALCLAVGFSATDTTQLIGKAVVAHVKVKDDRNEVRTYSAPTQAPAVPQGPVPASAVAQPTPALAPNHPSGVPPMGPAETYADPDQVPQTHTAPSVAPVQSQVSSVQNPPGSQQMQPSQGSRPWDR